MKVLKTQPALFALLLLCSLCSNAAGARHGRIESGQITSSALTNNLFGDSATRPFKVYLPPSYDTSTLHYPVIYVLHGHSLNEDSVINPNQFATSAMQPALDSMIGQRSIGEMIAVFVNGTNRLKGSFYLNSPVIGDYETYITQDLVHLIDSRYRTLTARENRGIVGFSMGGWGAMHLALKFPETFSAVVAESGFYQSRGTWADGLTRQLITRSPTNLIQFASVPFPVNGMQALFAGLLPNPQHPSLFADYPYDKSGANLVLNAAAHQRCLDGDVQNGDLFRYLAQLVRLNAIKLIHGTSDSIVPISETRGFTNALGAAGVPFQYEQHSGDHVFRADLALPFFDAHLSGAQKFVASPTLSLVSGTDNWSITFRTEKGVHYRLQSTGALSEGWVDSSDTIGDGSQTSVPVNTDGATQFFRLRAEIL